jgi:cytochrome c oxidase subunit II
MNTSFQLFPPHASALSWSVDWLLLYMTAVTVFFTIVIFLAIVFFGLKYRARPGHTAVDLHAPMALEIAWSIIPLGLCMVMFWWGTRLFISASRPPAGAMKIYVIGKQWMWKIQHPEGKKEINELHVPVGRPVWLVMSSQDVIHDFGLPAFRIKRDVIPGQFSEEWFTPDTVGEYHLFCDQYCGTQHAEMIGKVVVMEEKDYQRWLAGVGGDRPMREEGEQLFVTYNCMSCHGSWAPTMAGLYLAPVKLADGRTVVADDAYIRRSILDPGADIVDGYQANSTVLMPTFRGTLDEEQIDELVEYIKSLGAAANFGQPSFKPVPGGGSTSEMRKPGAGGPPPITRDPNQTVE